MAKNKRGGAIVGHPKGSLLSGSKAIFLAFLGVVIGGAFFLTGGNPFPKEQLSTPENPEAVYEIDESALQPDESGRVNLQLRTIGFKECGGVSAVTMMLDRSGSMRGQKINQMKNAVLTFTNNLSDNSVIGIQSFNSASRTTDIPVSYYRDVKSIISDRINGLSPGGETPTHDALAYAKARLDEALPQYPDRKFSFIFLSDGIPVPPEQDPTLFDPNPADEIKNMGVTVYTIGIFPNANDSGSRLLQRLASSPNHYYHSPTGAELENIYKEIGEKICSSVGS